MPCLPGFCPVMKPVHDTLEMVGMDERMGAAVPVASSAPSRGITPRAARSCTSGSPTPSRPITATRAAGAALRPPCRSRSRRLSLDLLLRDAHHLRHRGDAGADLVPAVFSEGPHPLLHGRVLEHVGRGALQDERPDHLVHLQELEDARPAAIAGLRAVLAARALVDLHRTAVAAELALHRGGDLRGPAALLAHL